MRSAVTQNIQSLFIFGSNEFYFRVVVDDKTQIHQLVIELHRHAVAGKTIGNALGDFKTVNRIFKRLYVTVGKCYIYHFNPALRFR